MKTIKIIVIVLASLASILGIAYAIFKKMMSDLPSFDFSDMDFSDCDY